MRVDTHAAFQVEWIVFHIFSPVCFIVKESVCVIEHGLLDDFLFPIGDIFVALIPRRAVTLALSAMIHFPIDTSRTVFQFGTNFLRDVNELHLLDMPRKRCCNNCLILDWVESAR